MGGPSSLGLNSNSTNANTNTKSSSYSSMGNGVPKTGRELAIEALIDLDDRGPSFRVNRILNEAPKAAVASRPNKISRAALFDVAQCLSQHQMPTSDYLRHSHQPSLSFNTNDTTSNDNNCAMEEKEKDEISTTNNNPSRVLFKDPSTPAADGTCTNASTDEKETSRPPTEKERERVMKHFAKIILANQNNECEVLQKTTIDKGQDEMDQKTTRTQEYDSSDENKNDDSGVADADADADLGTDDKVKKVATASTSLDIHDSSSVTQTQSVCASPPPQLVACLRKIYGTNTNSSEWLDELEDSDGSSGSNASATTSGAIVTATATSISGTSTTTSSLLPNLIQAIVDHDIFSKPIDYQPATATATTTATSTNDINSYVAVGDAAPSEGNDKNEKNDEPKKESTISAETEAEAEGAEDGGINENEGHDENENEAVAKEDVPEEPKEKQQESDKESPSKPSPIHSIVGNLEALIGNACNFNPNGDLNGDSKSNENKKDTDEILLGIVIAAFSILTSSIVETTSDDDISPMHMDDDDDDNDTTIEKFGSSSTKSKLSRNANDNIINTSTPSSSSQMLQVAGPLSLHTFHITNILTRLEKTTASTKDTFEKLYLDPVLMNYFMEAASVCIEREEVQRENNLMKVKGVSASASMSVSASLSGDADKKNVDDAKKDTSSDSKVKDGEEADLDEKKENESSNSSGDRNIELDPEEGQNEMAFSEPHGYSFAEDDQDDDSSQEDEDDDSSSSSSDENEQFIDENELNEEDEERPILEEPKEENHEKTEDEEETKDGDVGKENENNVQNSSHIADINQDENEEASLQDVDSTMLHEALALSLTENLQDLPHLPLYPNGDSQPEDVTILNPTSSSRFGKLPPCNVFVSLLHIALGRVENIGVGSVSHNTTIHVMIAMLHVLSTERVESIKGLRDLFKKLKECDGQYKTDDNMDQTMEDDDPAFAASPLAASAYSSSESLKEKGMTRKAAAAAQSASLQRAKIQQNIDSFRDQLKLYSLSSCLLMKCLRCFMQASSICPPNKEGTCKFFPLSLPTITRVRLSASLATFMSSSISKQYYSMVTYGQSQKTLDEESLPVVLLLEAASLWGEATPLIYPSPIELENQLRRSIKQCFPAIYGEKKEVPNYTSFADIKYPWSDFDASLLKVDSMCRRLRCEEIIGYFIPSPKIYNSVEMATSVGEKIYVSSIYTTLARIYYEVVPNYNQALTKNVKALFLAFHHRYNQDLLLWKNSDATYLEVPFGNDATDSSKQISDSGDAKVYLVKNPSLTFDSGECADSISLIASPTPDVGAQSAHQRASKVWGTVLSSKMFNPKSGVHRWAVRLDKCERGHVFVGVATSRASKKTYVGGDKFSWGVIGTQALWHERRKIRSDYGNTFRTGSTVIITLDTDAGTLGFGILHDSEQSAPDESSSSESVSLISPYVDSQKHDASGFVEDWGVAFEGLPLDAKLFPAVGLYQRDDKVTLLSVAKSPGISNYSPSLNDLVQGPLLYPGNLRPNANINNASINTSEIKVLESVRSWNSSICNEGIFFATNVLNQAIIHLMSETSIQSNIEFFRYILPSVASSLALYPLSIPVLSGRFAMILLPLIHRCILLIEDRVRKTSAHLSPSEPMKSGKWTIRAAPCTSSVCAPDEYEEYILDIQQNNEESHDGGGFQGKGIGTSGKSINCKVSIVGSCRGTCIQFAEEWKDECETSSETLLPTSSCVIDAKMNLYGTRFEGVYKNVHYGKCGNIAGFYVTQGDQNQTDVDLESEFQQCLVRCSSLFGMAINHLGHILSRGAPASDVGPGMSCDEKIVKERHEELQKFISLSPILFNGLTSTEEVFSIEPCANSVISYFLTPDERVQEANAQASSYWKEKSLPSLIESCDTYEMDSFHSDEIHNLDIVLAPQCGGLGSLSLLEPQIYRTSREKIIAALLHHTKSQKNVLEKQVENHPNKEISSLWHTALQIIETGVRSTLFQAEEGSSRKRGCTKYCKLADSISDFLLTIPPQTSPFENTIMSVRQIYSFIKRQQDISSLIEIMKSESRKGVLVYFGLSAVRNCVNGGIKTLSSMESMISSWSCSDSYDRGITLQSQEKASTMYGCSKGIMTCIYKTRNEVLSSLSSRTTDCFSEANPASSVSLQSLSLMVLSGYFSLAANQLELIDRSMLWNFVKCLISSCRDDLESRLRKEDLINAQKTPSGNASILFASMKRQTGLSILNCSSSMLHMTLYLLLNSFTEHSQEEISLLTQIPLSIFRDELDLTLDLMKQEYIVRNDRDIRAKVDDDCDRWLSAIEQDSDEIVQKKDQDEENKCISTGVNFIIANVGAFIHESSSDKTSLEDVVLSYNSYEGYFVLLLNILSSLVRSKSYPYSIQNDRQWINSLLDPIVYNKDNIVLPLRLRIRILRFLRFMIPMTPPDGELVTILLNHVGNVLLPTIDEKAAADIPEMECYVEVKEVIALLRCLSLPDKISKGRNNSWQNCIINALSNNEVMRGVHGLFGGIPDKLVVGSCVLLKPSAASTIAATSSQISSKSSSGSSRSKGNVVSMAPVAASSGAEGIVAGLCRRDALAGRISEIDIMKGTCEIVLFDRSNDLHGHAIVSMSVRALKVPLLEVVAADEISLLIDHRSPVSKMTCIPLLESLRYTTSLLEQINDENFEEKQDDFQLDSTKILDTMMNLRSSAIIFSNPELLQKHLQDSEIPQEKKRECFAKLMQLGALSTANDCYTYTNSACGDSLSSLPEYQARFWYLRGLLLEATQRKNVFRSTALETFLKITKKVTSNDQSSQTPTKDSSDENIHVTPPVSRQDHENVSTADVGDESSQGRRSGNDVSGFQSNSIETVNDDEEENEEQSSASRLAEETEAAHLREAAIVQMAELGLPRSWSEYALRRVGGTNIEAAVHFCLERGGDMERLLLEEEERNRRTNSSSSRRRSGQNATGSSHLLRQLVEMGFPPNWCAEALSSTGHNVDEALTWMIRNGERLSALDEGVGNGDEDEDEEEECESAEEDGQDEQTPKDPLESTGNEHEQKIGGWRHDVVCPLRSISGRTNIDNKSLVITGLPTGGFSSVGMKGIPLERGQWYYEAELITDGCLQIGWADSSFSGHCQADRGDGCGDGPSSWAFDGWRRYRWHSIATEWGCRWREGDIVGCLLDMDKKEISFTLNGRGEDIGMGVAFSGDGFRPCGGVYACISFNRREKIRLILGDDSTESFHYPPPPGYKGVAEAVMNLVEEREKLLEDEEIIIQEKSQERIPGRKPYLCDFSDGEHGYELFAWQHRYYGSDASVHLGGRSNRTKGSTKRRCLGINPQPTSKNIADLYRLTIDAQLAKAWEKRYVKEDVGTQNLTNVLEEINIGYDTIISDLKKEMNDNTLAICVLYARKFIMHVAIAMSSEFSLDLFCQDSSNKDDLDIACSVWGIVEKCCGLHAAGWVGEAGAMAVASEALGLAISSHDRSLSSSPFSGFLSMGNFKNGKENGERTYFPSAALSQFLSTAKVLPNGEGLEEMMLDPSLTLASCAEAALGGDVGGTIIFIRQALQNAVITSNSMARVLLAVIRRSVRLLSSVEYGDSSPNSNDSDDDDDDEDEDESNCPDSKSTSDAVGEICAPDARLTSFLTGMLLSKPVCKGIESSTNELSSQDIADSLFVSWSVGLLSASAPWRMVCAMTVSSILDLFPMSIKALPISLSSIHNFYARLNSTVSRRLWAERSAVPICSRYAQSLVELSCSFRKATALCDPLRNNLLSEQFSVDAATPIPLPLRKCNLSHCWEWDEAWVNCDAGWEVWTGSIEYHAVEWMTPTRSAVRSLTDGGEGPPMLREGCTVMRGLDWDDDGSGSLVGNEDGKHVYEEQKKERDIETKDADSSEENPSPSKKKTNSPKLPVGKVIGIEPWKGLPGLARRVKWNLTNEEGLYRYGGDGGRYDIAHVEVNDKSTRVRKRHPLPESLEQCTARYGFGVNRKFSILLRLRMHCEEVSIDDGEREIRREGILEMPDFGAGILAECKFYDDGAVAITEKRLLYGSKDSGWEPRFGQPSYVSGTSMVLSMTQTSSTTTSTEDDSQYEELLGSSSYTIPNLRNRADGAKVRVTSEMRLIHDKVPQHESISSFEDSVSSALLPPICFDNDFHSPSLSLSRDRRTVTCTEADGRCTAFGSVGFTKGVHYWEVKIEQADTGSIFIGVAEKPSADSSSNSNQFGNDVTSRLNRWLGWGFVNFRATYSAGAERVYGAHCHAGDTIGVLLDCDAGRLSFFYDGVKYGEHIMNDLGCAYENIAPFGFNADGCGSSGAGQGAPNGGSGHSRGRYPSNGTVQPKALWPVVGMRHPGDRVTFSAKWMTSQGVDGVKMLQNVLAVDEVLTCYEDSEINSPIDVCNGNQSTLNFPKRFVEESYKEFGRWREGRWLRTATRGSGPQSLSSCGLEIDIDTSPLACAAACASLGLEFALLSGDRVSVKRSSGRLLELPEDAEVLGAYQGRLWYKIISQKSEGGSLSEGGGRAWFWDESEVLDNSLQVIGESQAQGIHLPLLDKFKCCAVGGLRIIYSGGAVVRSDLEIFDGSENIGNIPEGTIVPQEDVIERRMNSCGVVRYRVKYDGVGQGWISSRIRGGKEEAIVELVHSCEGDDVDKSEKNTNGIDCSQDSANIWLKEFNNRALPTSVNSCKDLWSFSDIDEFEKCLSLGIVSSLCPLQSDSLLTSFTSSVADFSHHGDAVESSFDLVASALFSTVKSHSLLHDDDLHVDFSTDLSMKAYQSAASKFSRLSDSLPPMKCLLARIAMLRALNRRAKYALPWLLSRPSQESSAVLGGLAGFGASVERCGKSKISTSSSLWVQASSCGTRLRDCRSILFGSVKKEFLTCIINATTTPTPLSHDEYELPREVRTIRVNRVKARHAMSSTDTVSKKKNSVFSQLQNETRGWSGAALRRGHVAKGHGGQKRAFKVKLIGEGVNDYSGPYREVFTDAIREVISTDESMVSALGVLDPTPNRAAGIGEDRSLLMFSFPSSEEKLISTSDDTKVSEEEMIIRKHYSSYLVRESESLREAEESVSFLGKLASTAVRHGILVDLLLPLESIWKPLCEERNNVQKSLQELDLLTHRYHNDSNTSVPILVQQQRMLNAFTEGISSVMPVELLSIFSGSELRDFYCGNSDIDVDLLQKIVEYEGYTENDAVIKHFWEVLREMTSEERKQFLQFVWARSRLPIKESEFEDPFKIQRDTKCLGNEVHTALPSASTCFFSLSLPQYQDKETLKQKLIFAINNVTTMESDYVTNDSEVREGWRGM